MSTPADADERHADAAASASRTRYAPVRQSIGRFPDPRTIGAEAYTVGREIVVAADLDLHSSHGQHVLAHEMAHVTAGRGDALYRKEENLQSYGETTARAYSDAGLEAEINYMLVVRDRSADKSIEREVAEHNLEVLGAESERRGLRSPALACEGVRVLAADAANQARELSWVITKIAKGRDGLRNHPVTETFVEYTIDRVTQLIDMIKASVGYLTTATSTGLESVIAMATTRIQAAECALSILRPWCALVALMDNVSMLPILQLEFRFTTLEKNKKIVDTTFAELSSFDPGKVAGTSQALPARVAEIGAEIDFVIAQVERAEKLQRRVMIAEAIIELVTLAASLKGMFAMRGPPSARTLPMPSFMMVSGGRIALVQAGVSAEMLEALRRLVQIGAISAAGVAEMLRVRGMTSAMAANTELPKAVKDYFGEGPTGDSMNVASAQRAGASRTPRHHTLPQEFREFFEERGFTGDFDIDQFCIEPGSGEHQAQHGGGNWRLARSEFDQEWNAAVMRGLDAEKTRLGRPLNRNEILAFIVDFMRKRGYAPNFVPYNG